MFERESLADHAADRQPDIVHAGDRQRIEYSGDIAGQRFHRIVAGDRIAPAMAAHIEPEHTKAGLQQRRNLFGPTAAIRRQRMRDANHRAILGSGEVVMQTASC